MKSKENNLEIRQFEEKQGGVEMVYGVKNYEKQGNKEVKIQQILDTFSKIVIDGGTSQEFADHLKKMANEIKEENKAARIQEVMDRSVEEDSKMTPEDMFGELDRIDNYYKEDVNVINAIADSYIYETEVILKNLEIGRNGLANNPKAMLYCNEYERFEGPGPLFGAQHISELEIQIDVKDMIVNGYRYRKYNRKEKEDLARKLVEQMCKKHCSNILEGCEFEVTDEVIKLTITSIDENLPIMNFSEYGIEMDKYIDSFHEIMQENKVNRAYIRFLFDNTLCLMRTNDAE